jgi:hypothetical protein
MFAVLPQIADRGANVQLEQYLETSGSSDKVPHGVSYMALGLSRASVTPGACGGVGLKYKKNGLRLRIALSMNLSASTNVHSRL